ncbi:uncharacterized protein TNCV_4412041 [Trichonephila clavipes]|nr:uncharacterized protein TNCV_4412041 [Trichonephila clavipes]
MATRGCVNSPNCFCYICGSYTVTKQQRNISNFVQKVYFAYFGIKLGDQDKSWAPHVVCSVCVEELRQWFQVQGFNLKNRKDISYPSKRSLKAVLLHNGNRYASVSVGHSVHLKECCENLEFILNKLSYTEHKWTICGDMKVISMLLGQQSGYTKFPCFLCEWDIRDRKQHYVKQTWPIRKALIPGVKNVERQSLVDPKKILFPPLHIKLGLMKQFVKALDKEGECFKYLL